MRLWRLLCAGIVLTLVGVPLAVPLVETAAHPELFTPDIPGRIWSLLLNTVLLTAGSLLLSLPAGTVLAVLLFRTDLPLRRLFLGLTTLALFIPLPLQITAWQAAFEGDTGFIGFLWGVQPGLMWPQGFFPAIWVHAVTATPWVTLIVGQSLAQNPPQIEEDALLILPQWRVFWQVTLPRNRAAIFLAGLWVAVQIFGEVSVTDMFQVRTLGEEVYMIFSQGGDRTLEQAVAASLPGALVWTGVVLWVVLRHGGLLPHFQAATVAPFRYHLGGWRSVWLLVPVVVTALLLATPVHSLLWKAGLSGTPLTWNVKALQSGIQTAFFLDGKTVYFSLLLALIGGGLVAALALAVCWTSRGHRVLQTVYVIVLVLACTLPAPVVGFGLKETILQIVKLSPHGFLAQTLYFGPSYVPLVWAYVLRTLPLGVAVLWPVVRSLPREWEEAAFLEGATPLTELVRVKIPVLARSLGIVVVAAAALSLNEVGAGRLVNTPGSQTFTLVLFDRMHYGVAQDVASLGLVLLLLLVLFAAETGIRRLCQITPRQLPPAAGR